MNRKQQEKEENYRVRARRKPSDFDTYPHGISLYSGCSCCCCCFHWVGAAIGGGVGYFYGWKKYNNKLKDTLRPTTIDRAKIGFAIGCIVSFLLLILSLAAVMNGIEFFLIAWIVPLVFLPFVYFFPGLIFHFCGGLITRRIDIPYRTEFNERDSKPQTDEEMGVYRQAGAQEHTFIDKEKLNRRTKEETWALFKIGGYSILFSIAGTLIGYLVLLIFFYTLD